MICHQYIDINRHSHAKVSFDQLTYYVHRKVCLRVAQEHHPHLDVVELAARRDGNGNSLTESPLMEGRR